MSIKIPNCEFCECAHKVRTCFLSIPSAISHAGDIKSFVRKCLYIFYSEGFRGVWRRWKFILSKRKGKYAGKVAIKNHPILRANEAKKCECITGVTDFSTNKSDAVGINDDAPKGKKAKIKFASYKEKLHVHAIPSGCMSGKIRLLRALSHPSLSNEIIFSYGTKIPKSSPDVVIIERMWDYSCDFSKHYKVLAELAEKNVMTIFETDDDLLSTENFMSPAQKAWMINVIKNVDGVIASTPNLARRLGCFNPNVAVVPNALDERLFLFSKEFKIPQENSDKIIIGYMGTFTHFEDLLSIIEPLRRVLQKYKDKIILEIVGIGEEKIIRESFGELPVKILRVPLTCVSYEKFTAWMQENVHWDFGIAPLTNSEFNQSKSDIKFLDYSVQGIPGIFSDVSAYRNSVINSFNGLLVSNAAEWEGALSTMIEDRKMRIFIAKNAHTTVWKNRMLEQNARLWVQAIKNLGQKFT